ncbi:hypothetical protein [Moraxella lacunata]|nr:hypothetical protein [Moraxella lacunata]
MFFCIICIYDDVWMMDECYLKPIWNTYNLDDLYLGNLKLPLFGENSMRKLILATLVGSLALTACSKPAEEATDAAVAAQEAANEAQVAAAAAPADATAQQAADVAQAAADTASNAAAEAQIAGDGTVAKQAEATAENAQDAAEAAADAANAAADGTVVTTVPVQTTTNN